jgi:hypothetical protein
VPESAFSKSKFRFRQIKVIFSSCVVTMNTGISSKIIA